MRVTVANDDRVESSGLFRDTPFSIEGEHFATDFYALPLAGHNVVLGTRCLATLGPSSGTSPPCVWHSSTRIIRCPGRAWYDSPAPSSRRQPSTVGCRRSSTSSPPCLSSPQACRHHTRGITALPYSRARHQWRCVLLTVQNRAQVHRKPTGDLVPFSPRRVLPRFVNPRIGSKPPGFSI
jgi:hypothetical protein